MTRRITEYRHLAILGAAWLLLVLYAYPGMMTMDSIDQLKEARAGFFTDSHPPAMSALWRLVDVIVAGPLGMLLIHSALFLVGLYLVLRRALRPLGAAIAASLLLLFPPIFTPLAVIWKDNLMAAFLMLGAAALMSERRHVRVAGLVACIAATAVRYNAPAATLPLVVLLFTWTDAGWRRYAIAVGAWLVITIAALGIGSALTDRQMHIWHSSLALMDIAGTLSHVDGTLPDDKLRELLRSTEIRADTDIHAALRRAYSAKDFATLIHGEHQLWEAPIAGTTPAPQAKRDAISRAWWEILTTYPGAYLAARAATMRWVLALTERAPESTVMIHRLQWQPLIDEMGITFKGHSKQWYFEKRLSRLATKTSLYRPWIYLVLALIMLAFCRGHRDVLALLLSGIGCEASLFVLAASPDYRYSHWLVVCTCTAIVMLVARRFVLHRPRGGESFGT